MKNLYLLLKKKKKKTQTVSFVWLKEHARIHQEGKDAHLQPQKKPRYHTAGCNGWIRSHNRTVVVPQCPSSSNVYCLFATQGRPRFGHFLAGSAAHGPSCATAQQTGTPVWWVGSQQHHEMLRQGLGFTLPGFRIQSLSLETPGSLQDHQRNWPLQVAAHVLHELNPSIWVYFIILSNYK